MGHQSLEVDTGEMAVMHQFHCNPGGAGGTRTCGQKSCLDARRVAARFQFAASLLSVLSWRVALPRYSLILAKKFSIRWRHLQASFRRPSGLCGWPGGCMPLLHGHPTLWATYRCQMLCRQQSAKRHALNQWCYSFAVMGLSQKQEEANPITHRVHQCHDFCGQPAPGSVNGLMLSPPFEPEAFW